jgi:uncharacterized membrane protein
MSSAEDNTRLTLEPRVVAPRLAWATRWRGHPAVRADGELSVGERAADYMRNGMGSWAFVFSAVVFLVIWVAVNAVVVRAGHHAFDAYPFILLNLLLSCLAAMQGAILLIAAKRADQISSELAAHDYAVNCRAEKLIEENTELTRSIKELTEAIHRQVLAPDASTARSLAGQRTALGTVACHTNGHAS